MDTFKGSACLKEIVFANRHDDIKPIKLRYFINELFSLDVNFSSRLACQLKQQKHGNSTLRYRISAKNRITETTSWNHTGSQYCSVLMSVHLKGITLHKQAKVPVLYQSWTNPGYRSKANPVTLNFLFVLRGKNLYIV